MSHHTYQGATAAASRRLTNNDRPTTCYQPRNEGGAGVRARSVDDVVDFGRHSSHGRWEMRAGEENDGNRVVDVVVVDYDDDDDDDDDEQEPMDILYEREVQHGRHRHHRDHRDQHLRSQSEPNFGASASATYASSDDLDLRLSMSADHLIALLQREAGHYSTPLPARYYPTEFVDDGESSSSSSSSSAEDDAADGSTPRRASSATIGPWRKRIASWMYDVVDHFHYDRNAVSVALAYIDRHVGRVLVENDRRRRRGDGEDARRGEPPIKRRHFQLIAVTCLYLAIKVHGELMEDDPVTGEAYDAVASLVHEVDGRAFLGARGAVEDEDYEEDDDDEGADATSGRRGNDEDDDDLRAMSRKIADLTRRHRMARWGSRLGSSFGLPLSSCGGGGDAPRTASASSIASSTTSSRMPAAPHSNLPYKPRKRGMLSGPLRLHSFVELSRGLFTARDIVETETKVLVSMNYVVNPPTSRRFVGELLRMLALCYSGAATVDGRETAEASATSAERTLGLDRREVLSSVLGNACRQIESAAAVPALSIGCLPSVVAYGAMLNAVEEEFKKMATSAMETDDDDSPQLEDYQRHYRRYSRSYSQIGGASSTKARGPSDRDLFLEAWKEQFLVAVFQATDGMLSPDSHDIFRVRELLLDQAWPAAGGAATTTTTTTSPTEGPKPDGSKTKRSPRSPRSVIFPNPRMLRGGSFFRQSSGVSSTGGDSTRLLSPYDARGRSSLSFRSLSGSSVAPATTALPHRMYYKQSSEPIAEVPAMLGGNGQTPDVSVFQNDTLRRGNVNNYEANSWRTSTGEAFQATIPNPPLFFSA